MKRLPADPPTALEASLTLLKKSNAELAQSTAALAEANDRLARHLGIPAESTPRRVTWGSQ